MKIDQSKEWLLRSAEIEGEAEVEAGLLPPLAGSPRVDFWAKRTGNFWLSNFYLAPIQWDGKEWPTSEHLYQALKIRGERDRERIRLAPTPKQAKELAHQIGYDIDVPGRAYLMRIAIREKFHQHPDLAAQLVATRGLIVEASPFDPLWGEGPRGCGLNLMGMLLMELRETLRENEPSHPLARKEPNELPKMQKE